MKNVLGSNLTVTLFGESHGDAIGVVIDGMSPGVTVDREYIDDRLSHRRPALGTDTPRVEPDNYQIVSGVFNDKTTGTPIAIVIPNENTKSKDYNYGQARPAHADYTAFVKYHGNEDYRGGGHFSVRMKLQMYLLHLIHLIMLNLLQSHRLMKSGSTTILQVLMMRLASMNMLESLRLKISLSMIYLVILSKDYIEEQLKKFEKIYGVDDYQPSVVAFSIGSDDYYFMVDCMKYGNKWYLCPSNAMLASIYGIAINNGGMTYQEDIDTVY